MNIERILDSFSSLLTKERERPAVYSRDHFFPKEFLVDDYFETHAEPHRYYPTSMEWPCYVIHFGRRLELGLDADVKSALEAFLNRAVRGRWTRRIPNTPTARSSAVYCLEIIEKKFIDSFSAFYGSRTRADCAAQDGAGEVLAIDCCPVTSNQTDAAITRMVNARIELHQEYITLTLFIPLHLAVDPAHAMQGETHKAAQLEEISNFGASLRLSNTTAGTEELLRILYDELPHVALSAAASSDPESIQSKLACLVREFTVKWRAPAKRNRLSTSKGGIFCVFHGAVLPPEEFCVWGLKPYFAELYESSPWNPDQNIKDTISFLNKFWYLAKPSVYKTGLHDVVANYLRNGSVIYTSNIGSQTSPDAKDYLRFLLLYNTTPLVDGFTTHVGAPSDGDCSTENMDKRPIYLAQAYQNDEMFWLSRIVSRLLTMGTLRLAAISDLKAINSAMSALAQIESDLSAIEGAPNVRGQYAELRKLIKDRMSQVWTGNHTLISRIGSNKVAFQAMKRQLDDLEITRIPGWQSYDSFINRRLVTTYERISEIAERYTDVWRMMRSRMDVIEAGTILQLTSIARHVGFAALSAALTSVVKPFAEHQSVLIQTALKRRHVDILINPSKQLAAWGIWDLTVFAFILAATYFFNITIFSTSDARLSKSSRSLMLLGAVFLLATYIWFILC